MVGGLFVRTISEADLTEMLLSASPAEAEGIRTRTLGDVFSSGAFLVNGGEPMRRARQDPINGFLLHTHTPDVAGMSVTPNTTLVEAERLLGSNPELTTLVVADRGQYIGVVSRLDLLAAKCRTLAPSRIGGMATPLGVYLTDGVESGGAGDVGLMLTGATLTFLYVIATIAVNITWDSLERHANIDPDMLLFLSTNRIPGLQLPYGVFDLHTTLPFLLMLVMLRLLPLAGYHAAEHQVVHCVERGEPLTQDRVARMPRPHPRCGTNIMAGFLVFCASIGLFIPMLGDVKEAALLSAIITLIFWRRLGTFIQQYFTTRPANKTQIASGIKAGEELMDRFAKHVDRDVRLPMRLWRMGLAQVFMGAMAVYALSNLLYHVFPPLRQYLAGL